MHRSKLSQGRPEGAAGRGRAGRGRARGRGGASAVLQRASTQLQGRRVARQEPDSPDEDDIGAYLSNLRHKTKTPQWDQFGESDIDISISSNSEDKDVAPAPTSKFLKKKPEAKVGDDVLKTKQKAGAGSISKVDSASAVLDKAAAFASKFRKKPQRATVVLSDSDLELGLSMDSDIMAEIQKSPPIRSSRKPTSPVREAGPKSKAATKRHVSGQLLQMKSASPSFDDESISIGIDGSKFTKGNKANVDFIDSDHSMSESIGKGGSKFLKKKKHIEKSASPTERFSPPDSPKRQSMFRLRSSEKHATQVQLDTDEESLADFIGGLSSSTDGAGSARTPRTPSSGRQTPSAMLKQPIGRSGVRGAIATIREVDEDNAKSVDEDIDEDSFKINVFNLDDLEPSAPRKATSKGHPSKAAKDQSHKAKKEKKQTPTSQSVRASSLFASLGLQTVDDLLDDVDTDKVSEVSEVPTEVEEDTLHSASEHLSIRSESSSKHRWEPVDSKILQAISRSPSPEPVSTARGISSRIYTDEFPEDVTASETAASVYTSDTSQTKAVQMEESESWTADRESGRKQSQVYSDDFTETSTTTTSYTDATSKTDTDDKDTDTASSYSEDNTSYVSDSDTSSVSRKRSPRSARRNMRSIEVQTTEQPGLWYTWGTETAGLAGMTPPYGLHNVDPTPIATHVVKADALEALTAYSPSVLVLNDLLRQQLELTQSFIATQRRLHKAYIDTSVPDHHYTTLQDTKEYIAKHRKPKLTFDEALRQVKEDMGLE